MSPGETRDWVSAALADSTARSVADRSLRDPPKVPNGVRLAERNQISSLFETGFMRELLTIREDGGSHHAQCTHAPQQPLEVLQAHLCASGARVPRARSRDAPIQ